MKNILEKLLKRLIRVKFEGVKYSVSLKDKIYIQFQQFILLIKRQYRRFCILFEKQDSYLSIIVALLWFIFILIVFIWGKVQKDISYSLLDALWELKAPIFTSIILVFITNAYKRINSYRKKVVSQYNLYIDSLDKFELIFEMYMGKELQHYMPFYCQYCLTDTKIYISIIDDNDTIAITRVFSKTIQNIIDFLIKIENELKQNSLINVDEEKLSKAIKESKNKLSMIKIRSKITMNEYFEISDLLMQVIDGIRVPWRRDIDIKIKILERLSKDNAGDIIGDFYYSMLLEGYKKVYSLTWLQRSKKQYDQL